MTEKPPHLERRRRLYLHLDTAEEKATYSWAGSWVLVRRDGGVEYGRCAVCDRPLRDPSSRGRGVGPDCLREHGQAYASEQVEAAELADRFQWVFEHRRTPGGLPPLQIAGRLIDPNSGEVLFDSQLTAR